MRTFILNTLDTPFILICFIAGLIGVCYQGSAQVVINEVMVHPLPDSADADYMLYCSATDLGSQWVELYNLSKCDTVSLDCYMLGARTNDTMYGTYSFSGVKMAPLSFLLVGGPNVPNADIILDDHCGSGQLCGTSPWSLDNGNGWIALYNQNGDVQDAVYWTTQPSMPGAIATDPAFDKEPCVPGDCSFGGTLLKANQMGLDINYVGQSPGEGVTISRTVDGTGVWQMTNSPTPKNCNGPCVPPSDLAITISNSTNETCEQANGFAVVEITGGTEPYDIDWSTSENADSISGLVAGTYSASVTDYDGCKNSTSVTIIDIGSPVEATVVPDQATIFRGESVPLFIQTDAVIDSAIWHPANGLSCNNCADPIATPNNYTEYYVSIVDIDGCTGEAGTTISVLSDENSVFVATAFTPDGDHNNDVLHLLSPKIVALEWHIYDRWGKEVFSTSDKNEGWDGTDKSGKALNAGVYVYYAKVTFDNGKDKVIKGNVALLK